MCKVCNMSKEPPCKRHTAQAETGKKFTQPVDRDKFGLVLTCVSLGWYGVCN